MCTSFNIVGTHFFCPVFCRQGMKQALKTHHPGRWLFQGENPQIIVILSGNDDRVPLVI